MENYKTSRKRYSSNNEQTTRDSGTGTERRIIRWLNGLKGIWIKRNFTKIGEIHLHIAGRGGFDSIWARNLGNMKTILS